LTLPPVVVRALQALSQREGVTLFMTLLAAFQALLHRYTGQDDVCLGVAVANRHHPAIENLIGFFVNTLVMRTDLGGNPTFREVLPRVRETCLGAYAHQDLPFDQLVQALQPERDLSRNPFFQVLLVLQNAPGGPLAMPALHVTPHPLERFGALLDLTLYVEETSAGLETVFEYNTDLFDAPTIARLMGHWRTLLEAIVANPDQRLGELPILTPAERRQLLIDWNNTRAAYPCDTTLHERFEAQTALTPDAPALKFGAETLTYAVLNRRANQLAHYLQQRGAGPYAIVGVCLERSPEMVVALLGILKSGAAYLPLDPAYPAERLAFMLADSRATLLVTDSRLRARFADYEDKGQAVCGDAEAEAIAQLNEANPPGVVRGTDPAYVMYTSGSTGQPKGVVGLHRGALNRLHWMWQTYPFAPHEVTCQKTALSFGDSVWEVFGPLLQGIPSVIVPDDEVKEPRRLVETLAAHAVTRIVLAVESGAPDTAREQALQLARQRLEDDPATRAECSKLWSQMSADERHLPDPRDVLDGAPDLLVRHLRHFPDRLRPAHRDVENG